MEKDVYQKLAEKIMVPSTGLVPDLFRMLVNEEDAEIHEKVEVVSDAVAALIAKGRAERTSIFG